MQHLNSKSLLILILLSCLSVQLASADPVPVTQNLPPNLINSNQQTYIFSGFGETVQFDIGSNTGAFIIQDLEAACAISSNDTPFYSRFFIDSVLGAFYYCPTNKTLMILDAQTFSPTGNSIDLSTIPVFDEVRIMTFQSYPGLITILGLLNSPNQLNPNAKNFTASYFVTISWESKKVTKMLTLQGAHNEPIVGLVAITNGQILVVGEKVYDCGEKLDTYYIGKWGDSSFNQVIDFYISTSFVFVPHISITNDEQYLIYTNDQAIFGYNIPNFKIIQNKDVTLVASSYVRQDGEVFTWEQIPLAISSKVREVYVYNQGNLTQVQIPKTNTFVEGSSISLTPLDGNSTYARFYFFKEESDDKALIQIRNSTNLFSLSDSYGKFRL